MKLETDVRHLDGVFAPALRFLRRIVMNAAQHRQVRITKMLEGDRRQRHLGSPSHRPLAGIYGGNG